eukprot:TRINITY_DN20711_c0_g1_i2.p1 TRINITY_DN20711_c0_g1~~TRINITY_DN20711_c0_g1_i2.p1  ORF type:complete len:212 (-),score=9.15 TRINITY_DN20711_c0_g1_i2:25-660(-)
MQRCGSFQHARQLRPQQQFFKCKHKHVYQHQHPRNKNKDVKREAYLESGYALWCAIGGFTLIPKLLQVQSRYLSPPVIAIGTGMLMSWLGVIPCSCVAYNIIQQALLPFALALFLLEQNISNVLEGSKSMLVSFLLGAFGIMVGTVVAWQIGGHFLPQSEAKKVAAALCATYIGGTVNFVAVGQDVVRQPQASCSCFSSPSVHPWVHYNCF